MVMTLVLAATTSMAPGVTVLALARQVSVAVSMLRRRSLRTLAVLALVVLVATTSLVHPVGTRAASGTYPTNYNTGSVTCTTDLVRRTQSITVKPGAITSYYRPYHGTVTTWSWVQYTYDGNRWTNWYHTPVRAATFSGVGALNPAAHTFTFAATSRVFAVRVRQYYQFSTITGTRSLTVDHYTKRLITAADPYGIYGQVVRTDACIFP